MKESLLFLEGILKDNDTLVCATSGGVDSMCLLNVLIKIRNEININIICAHINHNLRYESFEEYEFVKKYCKVNNVIFEGTVFDKEVLGNFESESRKKRYDYFESIVNKYNAEYLLTAHHGDDLIETVLMRLTRGSTLDGYEGFSVVSKRGNYKLLRPFIYSTKDELYSYARDNNIEYREDKTNKSEKYTRNRYRQNILPFLKKEDENVHLKFLKFSESLRELNEFVNSYVTKKYNEIYIENKLNLVKLKGLDVFIVKKICSKILSNLYKDKINYLNDKHISLILNVLNSQKPNISIDLPLNVKVVKKYNILEFKGEDIIEKYSYIIDSKEVIIPTGKIKKVDNTNLTNNYVCHLNSKSIKLPLYVRNKNDGDFIEVLGLNGKKKIKDIFINEKIDVQKRKKYPVVVDSENRVVWLPGLKKSKYDTLKTKNYDIILWYIDEEEDYE